MVQKNMNNAIVDLCEDATVTETDMYAIIMKITPKANLQDSLDVLDKHKTHALVKELVISNGASTTTVLSTSEGVCFEQNSKLMYDNMLEETPWFIRKMVQKNMNNAIADLCEEIVTENDMYEVVKQITPKANLQNSIDALDKHKTHAVKELVVSNGASTTTVPSTSTDNDTYEVFLQNSIDDLEQFEEELHRTSSFMVSGKEVRFEQNSKLMYDKILEGHPVFVRKVVKNNLDKAISEMCGEVMTENDMYEVINVASPKPLLKFNRIILDEHKTS